MQTQIPEIKGFIPNSLVDWDGKVSSVIFLANCNFRCKFCSNKELVLEPAKLKNIQFEEVEKFLEKSTGFIDGIVISGGEPCIHSNLIGLLRKLRKFSFQIKIDTNGSYPEILKQILNENLADYIAMDIKTNFEEYASITNSDLNIEKIKESIEIIKKFSDYEFRITMYPRISEDNLMCVARYLEQNNANKKFVLQQFRAENCMDEETNNLKPYSEEQLKEMLKSVQNFFQKVELRNA
ncbi:MAG: anaerobic ribonucleoside-triphosphate reductase activating protein [Nanoarchaeota archaeon]